MSPNDNIQFAGFKLMEDLCPFRSLCESVQHRNIDAKVDQSIEYGVNMSHKIDEVIAADEAQKPDNEVVEDTEETEEGDE